jgi:protein O-GlcNAc transferase
MSTAESKFHAALAALNAGRFAEAERLLRMVLKAAPEHVGVLNLLALALINLERFAEAERFIAKALILDQSSAASFYNHGIILKKLRRPREALEQFNRALRLAPNDPEMWNNRGTVFNDLRQFERAIGDFDQAIALHPRFHEALCNKGRSLAELRRHDEALAAFDQALTLMPDLAAAWSARGQVLGELKRYDEALSAHERALAINPDLAEAWLGRENILCELGHRQHAGTAYDKALALRPDLAEAWLGRGNIQAELKHLDEAIALYDRALSLKPDLAEAWLGRGNTLYELGHRQQAGTAYDKALALRPDLAEAWLGRGNVLVELKHLDEAITLYDRALSLKPDLAEAWLGRGNILYELGHRQQAGTAYDKALALRPDLAEAWLGRGNVLVELKHLDEAIAPYDRALSLKPDLAEAWMGRGNALRELRLPAEAFAAYGRAFALKPNLPGVEGARLHAKMLLCDWRDFAADCEHLIASVRSGNANAAPFVFANAPCSAEDQLACARAWVAKKCPRAATATWQGEIYRHARIRVAYVSADFHDHATAHLTAGLFEHHDRSRFEVVGFSIGPADDSPMRRRLAASFDRFVDGRTFEDNAAADWIRKAEIDILVDLKGFTQDARTGIFARRPAPVQVSYLGYPGTMGADYIDYLLADHVLVAPSQQAAYSEKIVYLPDCYQINDRRRPLPDASVTRPDMSLPEKAFVFCCFNNCHKIIPAVFDGWMRLLKQVDDSVLWLFEDHAGASTNLRSEASARGIDPGRLIFAQRLPLATHLARYRLADLFLDTLPYNAHTTASDALWVGLPVVTQIGGTFAGRVPRACCKRSACPN